MSRHLVLNDSDVEYILWSLSQNVNEIEDSLYFDEESVEDVKFILHLINIIEVQIHGHRVTEHTPRTVEVA
jgi:hypothetical protein